MYLMYLTLPHDLEKQYCLCIVFALTDTRILCKMLGKLPIYQILSLTPKIQNQT